MENNKIEKEHSTLDKGAIKEKIKGIDGMNCVCNL